MRSSDHSGMLREVGLTPTIQRLAILDWVEKTKRHPTADQVHAAVRKKFPTISRATVYNTLDALTKAGMILKLSVDPTAARYDADLDPHAHFRCRVCNKVYDIPVGSKQPLGKETDGHLVESVLTYAYGVCADCLRADAEPEANRPPKNGRRLTSQDQPKESTTPSAPYSPDRRKRE